uniref:phage tail tape measure protein n=1 Tax=Microbacterium proteolyticum TaxID=1572644 RepID=UPI002416E6FC|nr:phage tail tape measure protein [Microbacterium proteolyticum]
MADRVVSITLRAKIAEYKANMLEAANATRAVGTEGEKLAQVKESLNLLGGAALGMGAALAAGVGVAINSFAQFDKAMSAVAATGEDARNNLGELRQAAIDAGQSTVFSASEAANAIEEMAKAGVSAKDILGGGLTGALNLAAAGGLGVAEASGIAATTLQQFKLEGKDASHVADLLAAGAGKAMGDVTDMAQALNQGGLVASQFGISVEETTGTLAAFAQAGLLGSDAGTSFRTMLLRLANPTDESAALMKDLGINAYDAGGNFVGMANLAGQLQKSLGGLTQEQRNTSLAMIFGQDAIRGANVLFDEGTAGIRKWTSEVDDQGYAAETAATKLNNLSGDVEKLHGALETAFITMGEGANGPLRSLVQGLANLVDGFNDLPDWLQQTTLGVVALIAGVALLGGGMLLAVPKIAEFKNAMETLNLSGGKVAGGLRGLVRFLGGPWGVALAVATAATIGFNKAIEDGQPVQAELQNKIAASTKSVDAFQAAFQRGGLETALWGNYADQLKDLPGLLDRAAASTNDWLDLSRNEIGGLDSIKQYGDALAKVASTDMPRAQASFASLREQYKLNDAQALELLKNMPAYRDMLLDQATAAGITADDTYLLAAAMGENSKATDGSKSSSQDAAKAYQETADKASALDDQIRKLIDSVNEANGVGQDAVSANLDYQDALAKVDETIQKARDGADGYALTMDTSTQAGRDNTAMLVDLASQAQDAAEKQFALDGNTAAYKKSLEDGRQALIDRATDLGMNAEQAQGLADQIYRIPSETQWKVIADTATANQQVSDFLNRWNGVQIRAEMFLDSSGGNRAAAASAARYTAQAQAYLNANGNESGGFYSNGVRAFVNGGFPSGIYRGGAEIHKFAEKTLPWEAYISPKPDKRAENIGIWQETGRRLGATAAAPSVSIVGAQISGSLDLGDGLVGVIRGQIVAAQEADSRALSRGKVNR